MKQKKVAIITGASSGIGFAITQKVLELGYEVIGISRTISKEDFNNENFTPLQVNLTNQKELENLTTKLKKEKDITLLINCAGFGVFAPHEELNSKTIFQLTTLNLTAPMILTNAVLRNLKKNGGHIINISSIEALRSSKFSATYSATKSGLQAFGNALFEELRKFDVGVTTIAPDMTQSAFFKDLNFDVSQKEDEKLLPQDIAYAVEHILNVRDGVIITEYTLRSSKFGIRKKKRGE